jgi:hypothetical protein
MQKGIHRVRRREHGLLEIVSHPKQP